MRRREFRKLVLAMVGTALLASLAPSAGAATAASHVAWRFKTDANYIDHRAAVWVDGTIYFNDSSGFLYAVNPDGTLKWRYDGCGSGSQGPTVLGADGTIYFGVGAQASIQAVNPDGTLKWKFVDPDSQGPIAGPAVGPDGNVYAVFDLPSSYGAVSLTPEGSLRWSNPGDPVFTEYGQLGQEIQLSAGQLYVAFDEYGGSIRGKLYALGMQTGAENWTRDTYQPIQVVTGTNGDAYIANTYVSPRLTAYSPSGTLLWVFGDNTTNEVTAPDVAPDGSIYVVRNLGELYKLSPQGQTLWSLPTTEVLGGPVVDPANDLVLVGGQVTYGEQGLIRAVDTKGNLLWEELLPYDEGGLCPAPMARPIFSGDSSRAYLGVVPLCVAPSQYYS